MIKKAIFRGIIPFVIMTSLAIFIRLQGVDIFQVSICQIKLDTLTNSENT